MKLKISIGRMGRLTALAAVWSIALAAVWSIALAASFIWPASATNQLIAQSKDKKTKAKAPTTETSSVTLDRRADLLLITNAELAPAWQGFADWKTATGRPTKIVTTEEIEQDFAGDDLQAKIRNCCLSHIEQMNTRWVVLGGDSEGDGGIVPDRDTDHADCEMLPYDNIPTDPYYVSPGDWDANGDGRFGVFADDLDAVNYYHPQATIGRIPVRTIDDVQAYTEKVIQYESKYPVGDFARRMIYTCPEADAYPKLGTSIQEVTDAWPQGYVSRFFANQTPWDDAEKGDYELVPDNWIDMINRRQASKIHMHGHGLINLWVLENNRTILHNSVAKLTNERAYPIITTVSCLTGQYDDQADPCIAESILRQPNAGAIAVLAPSREGVPFMMKRSDYRLMMTEGKLDGTTDSYTQFWKNALAEDLTIGEAFRKVKMEMESKARRNDGFHMCQCELNLLGDPSIRVHAAPPENFRSARLRRAYRMIRIRNAGQATVCVWDGKQEYHEAKTDERGRVVVRVNSDSDNYHVALMAPKRNTWYQARRNQENTDEPSDVTGLDNPSPTREGKSAIVTKHDSNSTAKQSKAPAARPTRSDDSAEKSTGRSIENFKKYVADRLDGIPAEQLDKIVDEVDQDNDQVISDEEFEQRMKAIRAVLSAINNE